MKAVKEIRQRGIKMEIWNNITDSRGRTMYYCTVDGETIAKGYSLKEVESRARAWAQ